MRTRHFKKAVQGVTAIVALCTAFGATAQTSAGQAATGTAQTGAAAAPATSTLNAADQRMLKTMALNNLAEIEAGRMAQSKTRNDAVRTFAQRMIDDHTKALADIRELAQSKGVALPTELDRAHRRKADRLAAMSGDAFDRAYMAEAGVADHKRSHAMLRKVQARAKDPDLQALAARTLPVVDQHLDSAQEVHKNTARGSGGTQGQTGASPDKKQ